MSLGWLSGLSASPVIASAIGIVLGGVVGAVVALRRPGDGQADLVTAFTVIFGMGVGAPAGLFVRTHDLLGAPKGTELMDSRATQSEARALQPQPSTARGVLFATSASYCRELDVTKDDALRGMLSAYQEMDSLLQEVSEPAKLRLVVRGLCGAGR